jgi:hypothetical protein
MTYVLFPGDPAGTGIVDLQLDLLPNYATSGNFCPETPVISAVVVPLGTSAPSSCVWRQATQSVEFNPMTTRSYGAPPSTWYDASDECLTLDMPVVGNGTALFVNYVVQEYTPYGPVAGVAGEPTTSITGECTIVFATSDAAGWEGSC